MFRMSNGPLTQTINAASATADHILGLTNLPPEANALKSLAIDFKTNLKPQLVDMQNKVLSISAAATIAMTDVQAKLVTSNGHPDPTTRDGIVQTLNNVQAELKYLGPITAAADASTTEYYTKVTAGSQTLAAVSASLDAQRAGLQGQLQSAQSEVDSIKDKMKYYGFLGLAGIPGLIAMGVLLSQANDRVNEVFGQIRTLDNQILQTEQTLLAVRAMLADFQNLSTSTLSVKTAVEFVVADVDHALRDVQSSTGPIALIYVTTALSELRTLSNDAS